jgi:DNA-binding transcriptional ArsR family regulator
MKTLDQTVNEAQAVQMLRALGNPIRYRIVQLLAQRNTCVTGELVDELPLVQSTVSSHLKVLKDAGLIEGTVEGPNTCYCLRRDAFAQLTAVLAGVGELACG